MEALEIEGPVQLKGVVDVSVAKNACLPIILGCLLTDQTVALERIPNLRDVDTVHKLLSQLGVELQRDGDTMNYRARELSSREATYELVRTMRASILVLGPMLARFGEAKVSLPGGCAIGARPIDIHLEGLKKMGADIQLEAGYVHARATRLKGASIALRFPSVGATENLMMAATLAKGETVIKNAAREPEIKDLARFLIQMGAQIEGAGESEIVIQGQEGLEGTRYRCLGDRIEAATFIAGALITEGDVRVQGFCPDHQRVMIDILKESGAQLEEGEDFVHVKPSPSLQPFSLETSPYPGFPTDAQAQMMALATQLQGTSAITEKIFENRFMHMPELLRMGAQIKLRGNTALVYGPTPLKGAPVMCTDLRASAALVLAALRAQGTTLVRRIYHLDRGYEHIDQKLLKLGARLRRVS